MSTEQFTDAILELATEQGARYPTVADSSDGEPVIVDTDSGRVWRVKVEEI